MRESIHIASSHPAFDTRIFHKECKTLVAAGYPVTLIVPHPHDEVVDGVRIRAVPLPRDGRERLFRTLGLLYRAALEESRDAIFHFHDAELIFHMMQLKRRGRTVIYDAHEDTPRQVMYQHWIPKPLRPVISLMMRLAEKIGGQLFDGVIAAEPGILARFPPEKTALVHNFPRIEELAGAAGRPYAERPARVAYVGSITETRGVFEMVEAVRRLPETLGAELVLGGVFHPASLEAAVRQRPGAAHTHLLGWLDRARVAEVLGTVRAGLVTLYPTPKYLASYPTKLFEYMAAGLPVIASDFPGWRVFVEEAQCGLLVDPHDVDAIAGAIRWILEHPDEAAAMGARGREAVRTRYNWHYETQALLAFYERFAQAAEKPSSP